MEIRTTIGQLTSPSIITFELDGFFWEMSIDDDAACRVDDMMVRREPIEMRLSEIVRSTEDRGGHMRWSAGRVDLRLPTQGGQGEWCAAGFHNAMDRLDTAYARIGNDLGWSSDADHDLFCARRWCTRIVVDDFQITVAIVGTIRTPPLEVHYVSPRRYVCDGELITEHGALVATEQEEELLRFDGAKGNPLRQLIEHYGIDTGVQSCETLNALSRLLGAADPWQPSRRITLRRGGMVRTFVVWCNFNPELNPGGVAWTLDEWVSARASSEEFRPAWHGLGFELRPGGWTYHGEWPSRLGWTIDVEAL